MPRKHLDIDLGWLVLEGACDDALFEFAKTFGHSVRLTPTIAAKHTHSYFDLWWLFNQVLKKAAQKNALKKQLDKIDLQLEDKLEKLADQVRNGQITWADYDTRALPLREETLVLVNTAIVNYLLAADPAELKPTTLAGLKAAKTAKSLKRAA